ncbi:MAG: hypothetical protein M5U30_21695 [Burkholderiaceae bacterium]|nr:hypothetical protein [Burkholderiaceae bacterium]
MHHVLHDLRNAARVALADEGATLGALAKFDDSGTLERVQCLAHGVPADAELERQLALGRKLVPGRQRPGRELIAYPLADLLEGAAWPDGLEGDPARRGVHFSGP